MAQAMSWGEPAGVSQLERIQVTVAMLEFERLVLGDGIPMPEYGTLSCAEPARFYRAYKDYKWSVELGNRWPSVQCSLSTAEQLLRRDIRLVL